MPDDLTEAVIARSGGRELWKALRGLRIDISIGGPVWAVKGWPVGTIFHQIVTMDTVSQRIEFTPFIRNDRRMVFDAAADSVTLQTVDGLPMETLASPRSSFHGMGRQSVWDARQLGYFLGYACWNYFATPFLFTYPGVEAREIEPWREAGQTWRRLHVRFPPSIATHNTEQVFYFDADGRQRRMDYAPDVMGGGLVGHYTSDYVDFDGLLVATRRRVFGRNPDNTVDVNASPAITVDVHHVELV
jgi:hypothetical protein